MDRLSGAGLGRERKLQIWLMREGVNGAKVARQPAGLKPGQLGEISAVTELRPMLSEAIVPPALCRRQRWRALTRPRIAGDHLSVGRMSHERITPAPASVTAISVGKLPVPNSILSGIRHAAILLFRRDSVDREQPVAAMMLDQDCLASSIFMMAALRLASSARPRYF